MNRRLQVLSLAVPLTVAGALLTVPVREVTSAAAVPAAGGLLAQQPSPAPAPGSPAPNAPAPNVVIQRGYWFETGVIVVLFGAALFVVCRSSGRR